MFIFSFESFEQWMEECVIFGVILIADNTVLHSLLYM